MRPPFFCDALDLWNVDIRFYFKNHFFSNGTRGGRDGHVWYPLVNIDIAIAAIAIENGPVEIVDLAIKKW